MNEPIPARDLSAHSPRMRILIWSLRIIALAFSAAVVLFAPFMLFFGQKLGLLE